MAKYTTITLTKPKPFVLNKIVGIALMVMGVFGLLISIPLMFFLVGFITGFGACGMIIAGNVLAFGEAKLVCPDCKSMTEIFSFLGRARFPDTGRCHTCKKLFLIKWNS